MKIENERKQKNQIKQIPNILSSRPITGSDNLGESVARRFEEEIGYFGNALYISYCENDDNP